MSIKKGIFLPPFNDLADPHRLVDLAVAAEDRGWDGFFLWDHVLRSPDDPMEVADPWVALAAIASATRRIRIGTMVTPVVRRRPQVLVRQVVTLDHLSHGRVILGLGIGVDSSGELSRFGEITDPVERGAALDEGAELIARMMAGERIDHRGRYFTADGVQLKPPPLQQPRVPMWFGLRGTASVGPAGVAVSSGGGIGSTAKAGSTSERHPPMRPLRRAAKYDGVFLIDPTLGDLEYVVSSVQLLRPGLSDSPFDVAVLGVPEIPPTAAANAGATWWMTPIRPELPAADVEALVLAGPPE